jgi:hypothetical protein
MKYAELTELCDSDVELSACWRHPADRFELSGEADREFSH